MYTSVTLDHNGLLWTTVFLIADYHLISSKQMHIDAIVTSRA